ncbi:MAG: hypothetical protein C4542_08935 [Dehalococcoidia bacterium]|nr:MAG: hypothetical protein C4542_08935 [Dehalococcoidia bacterium]
MLQLIGSVACLALVAAGFAFIIGLHKVGKKLAVGAILGFALVALAISLQERCPHGSSLGWVIGAAFLLLLAVVFWRVHFLFKLVWWLAKGYVVVSYRVGAWLTEHVLLRFPVVLLPVVSRHLVMAACVALTQTCLVLIAMLISYFSDGRPLPSNASSYGWLGLPVAVILVVGNVGKWAYRREERQGLANV